MTVQRARDTGEDEERQEPPGAAAGRTGTEPHPDGGHRTPAWWLAGPDLRPARAQVLTALRSPAGLTVPPGGRSDPASCWTGGPATTPSTAGRVSCVDSRHDTCVSPRGKHCHKSCAEDLDRKARHRHRPGDAGPHIGPGVVPVTRRRTPTPVTAGHRSGRAFRCDGVFRVASDDRRVYCPACRAAYGFPASDAGRLPARRSAPAVPGRPAGGPQCLSSRRSASTRATRIDSKWEAFAPRRPGRRAGSPGWPGGTEPNSGFTLAVLAVRVLTGRHLPSGAALAGHRGRPSR